MKKLFKNIFNFFQKSKKEEEIKSIREYLPKDFLNFALNHVIYNKCAFAYSQKNWKVVNYYFTGATLCLDIKDESRNITDVITICTDNTFGFFTHYDICKRSKMLPEEIDKANIIRKSVNKKEYK